MLTVQVKDLVWLSSEDAVIDVLASVAVEARKKRAAARIKTSLAKQAAPSFTDNISEGFNKYVADPIKNYVGEDASKHIGYGLAGAGLGAGAGLVGSMFAPPKKRRPLSSMLTGGALGGILGAGGSLAYHNVPWLKGLFGKSDIEKQRAIAAAEERREAVSHSQPYSPELEAEAKKYRYSQESIRDLASAVQNEGRDSAYRSFLEHAAVRNKNTPYGRFSLPKDDELINELSFMERPVHGLPGSELRELGNVPDEWQNYSKEITEQKQQEYINKIMQSYAKGGKPIMRQASDDPEKQILWTQPELQKYLPKMMEQANAPSYQFAMPASAAQRESMYKLLDRWSGASNNAGMVGPVGRRLNDWGTRWTQGVNLANRGKPGDAASLIGRSVGVGNYLGAALPNEGMGKELARAATPSVNRSELEMFHSPAFKGLRDAGFDPVELLEAYRGGPTAINQLLTRALREERVGPDGQWKEDALRAALPGLIQQARQGSGAETMFTRGMDKLPTWGGVGGDLATVAIGADALGSLGAYVKDQIRGYNIDNLVHAIEDAGTTKVIGKLAPEQVGYLEHVYKNFGRGGLKRLAHNPMQFAAEVGAGAPGTEFAGKAPFMNRGVGWTNPFTGKLYGEKPLYTGDMTPITGETLGGLAETGRKAMSPGADLGTLESGIHGRLKSVFGNKPIPLSPNVLSPAALATNTGGGLTVQQALALEQEVSLIKQLPAEQQQQALKALLEEGVPKANISKELMGTLAEKPMATGPVTAAEAPALAKTLAPMFNAATKIPNLDPRVADALASIPAAERAAVIEKGLLDPNYKYRARTGALLTAAELTDAAAAGAKLGNKPGFLRRGFGGVSRFMPRALGYAAVPAAWEIAMQSGRFGNNSVEQTLSEAAKTK